MGLPERDKRRADNLVKALNVNRFDEIMKCIRSKYANTGTGRIKGAVKKANSKTPFYLLMQTEGNLLEKMRLTTTSPEVYEALQRYYGVDSHKHLERGQHKDWISRLEHILDEAVRRNIDPHDISPGYLI